MARWLRTLLLCLLVLAFLSGAAVWLLHPRNAMFHGKRESEWIKSINYRGDDAQTQQWRELGPDGARLLGRTLDRGRTYRKFYRWLMPRVPGELSGVAHRRLPNPADAHATRMYVVALLSRLGTDAKPAEPAIARALSDDEIGVRQLALGCYETGLLDAISASDKQARLPLFLRAMQDGDVGIRNNAAVALWWYTNQAAAVDPVLAAAVQDPDVHVRLLAAKALVHIDPQAAVRAGVVPVLVKILRDPDDQVAWQAPGVLGDLGKDAAPAVPALIERARRTDTFVAHAAARALKRIDPEAAARAGVW